MRLLLQLGAPVRIDKKAEEEKNSDLNQNIMIHDIKFIKHPPKRKNRKHKGCFP